MDTLAELASPPALTGDYTGDRRVTSAYLTMADGLLSALPAPPSRDASQRHAAELTHAAARRLRTDFLASHAERVYDELTLRRTTWPGLAELAFAAADLIPGLAPTRQRMAQESRYPQREKEGLEIDQGILFHALLDSQRAGTHLIESMRSPTERATGLLPEFQATGRITLTAARLERHGAAGHVTITNEHCLNAEDNRHVADVETLADIVLLDPGVRVGVLRGGVMTHPRYAGRRVFSAGINLKELRAGNISFVDFLLRRELGFISKLMRGIIQRNADWRLDSVNKPWLAAVDTFAIGGGAQILLACDRVIADTEAYFRLPAAKEGIVPGAANLRLTRFLGARTARQVILWGRAIAASDPDAHLVFDEVVVPAKMDSAISAAAERLAEPAVAANRHMLNLAEEPVDDFRRYLTAFALEQALRAYSPDVLGK